MVLGDWLSEFRLRLQRKKSRRQTRGRRGARRHAQRTEALELRTPPGDITGASVLFLVDLGAPPDLDNIVEFMAAADSVPPAEPGAPPAGTLTGPDTHPSTTQLFNRTNVGAGNTADLNTDEHGVQFKSASIL